MPSNPSKVAISANNPIVLRKQDQELKSMVIPLESIEIDAIARNPQELEYIDLEVGPFTQKHPD